MVERQIKAITDECRIIERKSSQIDVMHIPKLFILIVAMYLIFLNLGTQG